MSVHLHTIGSIAALLLARKAHTDLQKRAEKEGELGGVEGVSNYTRINVEYRQLSSNVSSVNSCSLNL